VRSKDEFKQAYATIFTPGLKRAIASANAGAVFCNWQGSSLETGVLWAIYDEGALKLAAVNLNTKAKVPEPVVTPEVAAVVQCGPIPDWMRDD
jgi:hypothetical protein